MIPPEQLVLCGEVPAVGADTRVLRLDLHGPSANVRLRISDISKALITNIPDELVDLLEVAAYVYAADGAVSRGGPTDAQLGRWWRRQFRFVLPVRCPELWSSEPVNSALVETLGFLSDDSYAFEFSHLHERPAVQDYLGLWPHGGTRLHPTR